MFCMGETILRAAFRKSSQFWASPMRPNPSAEVSLPSSAVACSASTWPCGVRSSARRMKSSITGPWRVSRTRNATGSPQATLIVSSRTANGRAPSGVM